MLQEKYDKWHVKFRDANERKEFEFIYQNRNEWLKLLVVQTPPISMYFEVLNSHQYKREWTTDEIVEIRNYFDEIRNIFMKKA